MRLLILSKEAWRDEQNGGNVLSNLFRGFNAEFAQIYCNEYLPCNNICKLYYQITDKEMVKSILGKRLAGKCIEYKELPSIDSSSALNRPESYSGLKKWLKGLLPIFREIAWWLGRWNEKEIEEFVKKFNPDIIFAPCYGNHYMHKLTRLVHKSSGKNVISYISDDHYTNRQLHFSPWYWINHILLRKHTREIFTHYSLVFTMTEEQKAQCEKDFNANMKILCKAGEFREEFEKKFVNKPIRIVYAGGIYLNRWKTLGALADALEKIDNTGNTIRLDIYTNNPLTTKMNKALNRGKVSTVHKTVSSDELKTIYHASDIALHCESFDLINRLKVRLSFSTKIIDCLDSGCAVMAICDSKQAGFAYLHRNDAAICIDKPNEILQTLNNILSSPELLIEYQHKAFKLGKLNHDKTVIQNNLIKDFSHFISHEP